VLFIGSSAPALAAAPPKDSGAVTDQSALLINLAPGKRATLKIAVQNTGKTTWYKNGAQRTGLNTLFPLNSDSVLATPSWLAPWRPVRMTELTVKPGETAHFVFPIQAPRKPGVYYETMQVGHAVTNLVPGTDFRFVVTSGQKLSLADFLRGRLLDPNVTAASDPEKVTLSFKNTGRWRWLAVGNTAVHVQAENAGLIPTDGWVSPTTPAVLTSPVKPGATATFTFRLKHPAAGGNYAPTFRLFAGSTPIEGTAVTIPFTVDGGGTVTEPKIRVGLFTTTTAATVSASTDVSVTDGAGTALGTVPAGAVLSETYDGTTDTHTAKFGSTTLTTKGALRLVGPTSSTVHTITSFLQPAYNGQNDNAFRGTLEFRFASPTGKLWVINELPLDTYLLGLAEGANGMPPEYLKTLATAARSYALWHLLRGTKHANENYTLNATTDQVYRGVGFEKRAVDPVAATRATYGQVMVSPGATFPGNPYGVALAPYSACTDGRTRAFSEKFGGNQADWPWLVSVPDPNGICINQTYLAGGGGNHMVGMSASGARYKAETGGQTFDQILQYYYTGITVGKLY
jgi:peptidoglycan hydrolase-like amidase